MDDIDIQGTMTYQDHTLILVETTRKHDLGDKATTLEELVQGNGYMEFGKNTYAIKQSKLESLRKEAVGQETFQTTGLTP